MTSRIWIVMILLGGFLASSVHADINPSDEQLNKVMVDDVNQSFHGLHLKVQPESDPSTVYNEILQLIDYENQASKGNRNELAPNLKHLVCTSPACGPCSRGPC